VQVTQLSQRANSANISYDTCKHGFPLSAVPTPSTRLGQGSQFELKLGQFAFKNKLR
jgi:hypothetical protein